MTQLVGILNLTPDSFSGDGVMDAKEAESRIQAMIKDGAAVIDIGAESTRPNARPLSAEEEWRRLEPAAALVRTYKEKVQFSIDTRHVITARKALAVGFAWINDVSAGADSGMLPFARDAGCTLVLMHSLSIPADSSRTLAGDADPVEEVVAWGQRQLDRAGQEGMDLSRIVLDPGIGFGKTPEQSLALINGVARLKKLGVALMIGHSRKSFLSMFTDAPATDRDPETLVFSTWLVAQAVDYLRVHDVKRHAAMLRIASRL